MNICTHTKRSKAQPFLETVLGFQGSYETSKGKSKCPLFSFIEMVVFNHACYCPSSLHTIIHLKKQQLRPTCGHSELLKKNNFSHKSHYQTRSLLFIQFILKSFFIKERTTQKHLTWFGIPSRDSFSPLQMVLSSELSGRVRHSV